jgi:hypothetical protein
VALIPNWVNRGRVSLAHYFFFLVFRKMAWLAMEVPYALSLIPSRDHCRIRYLGVKGCYESQLIDLAECDCA